MLTTVLDIGLKSVDRWTQSRRRQEPTHPLAAYPRLHALLLEAERSGMLDAERRRVIHRIAA